VEHFMFVRNSSFCICYYEQFLVVVLVMLSFALCIDTFANLLTRLIACRGFGSLERLGDMSARFALLPPVADWWLPLDYGYR